MVLASHVDVLNCVQTLGFDMGPVTGIGNSWEVNLQMGICTLSLSI